MALLFYPLSRESQFKKKKKTNYNCKKTASKQENKQTNQQTRQTERKKQSYHILTPTFKRMESALSIHNNN